MALAALGSITGMAAGLLGLLLGLGWTGALALWIGGGAAGLLAALVLALRPPAARPSPPAAAPQTA